MYTGRPLSLNAHSGTTLRRRGQAGLHMKIQGLHRFLALLIIVAAAATGFACDSIYYKTMRKFGKEKRDILVKRVKDARASQDEAQKEFKSALERFQAIVEVDGGSLEEKYKKLNAELQRSEDRANQVKDRINAVRDVSKDLFKEWDDELGKYSDRTLRRESEREMRDTKRRTDALIASMARAQARVGPVLKPLRDRVLFLKHNLNARALGALTNELDTVRTDVDELVADMQRSIADADAFIQDMEKARTPEGG
jgi:hypothetical protein